MGIARVSPSVGCGGGEGEGGGVRGGCVKDLTFFSYFLVGVFFSFGLTWNGQVSS